MAENPQPNDAEKADDEAVLDLQNLQTTDEEPEVEAHTSTYSVTLCGTRVD